MSALWSTDIKSAPHGRYEIKQRREGVDIRVFVPERVILTTKCGKVLQSYYVPDEKRWMFLHHGEQPVAWMPWPEPYSVSPSQAAVVTGENLREPMAAASGQIIQEGDAPRETVRRDEFASCPDTQFTPSLPVPQSQAARPDALPLAASGNPIQGSEAPRSDTATLAARGADESAAPHSRADGGANIIMKHEDIRA